MPSKQCTAGGINDDDDEVYVPHTRGFISQLPSNEGLAWMGGNPVSSVAYDPSLEPPPDPYSHGSDERGEGRAQP